MGAAVTFNLESTEEFDQDFGDVMPLNEFIEECEDRSFIDYDGYASEVLLDNKVVSNFSISAEDMADKDDFIRKTLLELQNMFGELKIVWYNR